VVISSNILALPPEKLKKLKRIDQNSLVIFKVLVAVNMKITSEICGTCCHHIQGR
jgi:hypothetical protein